MQTLLGICPRTCWWLVARHASGGCRPIVGSFDPRSAEIKARYDRFFLIWEVRRRGTPDDLAYAQDGFLRPPSIVNLRANMPQRAQTIRRGAAGVTGHRWGWNSSGGATLPGSC